MPEKLPTPEPVELARGIVRNTTHRYVDDVCAAGERLATGRA
jgi:hypothetical protein